jgi:zinc/manganese transport system substrate-binding protein
MRREYKIILVVAIIAIAIGSAYATSRILNQPGQASTSTVQIVAAENFWGSLVSQLGGTRVTVLSIVSDPNADPHEYESNAADARAIADANYVILNGAGYDTWASNLIAANNSPNQKVLNVANLIGKKEGDNPHFWYSPTYVNETVHQMYGDLISIDSSGSSYYHQQYVNLNASLGEYNSRITEISQKFSGQRVASTESIFEYLATAAHLDLISPPTFMEAVAEGNDPTATDIATFQSQLINGTMPGNATVLVYNEQTVTPLTLQLKTEAASDGIPIVGVTETIQPTDVPFQTWMNAQLINLQVALTPNLGM